MFSEIEEIIDTLYYVDDNWNDEKFSDIWQEANTLVKERLTNTDYQFLDIKRKMNILHILCVVTHINNTYSCLLYTSPSPRDVEDTRMPSSA